MPGIARWLEDFRVLHEKARNGELGPTERGDYHAARDKFVAAVLAAQQSSAPLGQPPRRAVRVSRSVPVELQLGDRTESTVTLQVSSGGFGVLLTSSPPVGELATVVLHIPAGPVRCVARVMEVTPKAGVVRVGFQLVNVSDVDTEHLELFVLDAILGLVRR